MGIEKYRDMLYLPHPVSATHPHRTMVERAAQFSPFAALTGYEAAIEETGRLTDTMLDMSEDAQAALDAQLQQIAQSIRTRPEVEITFFRPDAYKQGGAYETVTQCVKKIDTVQRTLTTVQGMTIPLERIVALTIPSAGK